MDILKNQSKLLFGKKLRSALKNAGLKQFELAEKLRIEPANVSRWVNGKNYPEYENFVELCEILSVDESYFLEEPTKSESITELSKVISSQQQEIEALKTQNRSLELTPNEKRIIEAYRSAESLQRMAIETMAGFGLDKYPDAEIHKLEQESSRIIHKQKSS